jgi:hypothetical protein
MYFIFNFHVEGSFLLVYLLGILSGICGLSFGFIFGAVCDHEIEVMMAALAVYMPTLIASGGSWPREGYYISIMDFNYLGNFFEIFFRNVILGQIRYRISSHDPALRIH